MGYGYTCNDCGTKHPDEDPMLMGQLHEGKFMTSSEGGVLADNDLSPEETITICPACALETLL